MRTYDVAVVGAGPAGCSAALSAARSGLAVALFDRRREPASRCWEVLPAAARPLLSELDIWTDFHSSKPVEVEGFVTAWGDAEPVASDSLWDPYGCGWLIDRPLFDEACRRAAVRAGVDLHAGRGVTSSRRVGALWHVESRGDDGPCTAAARMLLDASGRSSPPPPGARRLVYDRLIGVARPYAGSRGTPGNHVLIEACPEGWFYTAPASATSVLVVFMTDSDLGRASGRPVSDAFDSCLSEAPHTSAWISGLGPAGPLRTSPAHTSLTFVQTLSGRALVGDSSFSLDPLSGQGLYHALASGIKVARAAAGFLADSPHDLKAYQSEVRAAFRRFEQRRREEYGREGRWPHRPFWSRRKGSERPQGGSHDGN
jgi:flavin-dependent dehydrogenase